MKKRISIGLMALMCCAAMQAQTKTVTLYNDDLCVNNEHYEIPTINYDNDFVSISADTLIYNVGVVVRDDSGDVIYSGNTTVTPADKKLNMPQRCQGRKYTVEVYYDDKYMYGYFEK